MHSIEIYSCTTACGFKIIKEEYEIMSQKLQEDFKNLNITLEVYHA